MCVLFLFFVLFLRHFLFVVLFCNVTAVDLIFNVVAVCLISEFCVFRLKMKWTR